MSSLALFADVVLCCFPSLLEKKYHNCQDKMSFIMCCNILVFLAINIHSPIST